MIEGFSDNFPVIQVINYKSLRFSSKNVPQQACLAILFSSFPTFKQYKHGEII